jgi:tRNA pseudouridine55 synthase
VSGVLVLDKPLGQSSNGVLQAAKRIFFAAKAGHTGSLDPLATGVLPLCFGEATKFSQYLLDSDKAYRSTFTLGITTASSDAEGEVLSTQSAAHITEQQVLAALPAFRGEIEQVPSMFSAIKHNGQPLYKLARQGKEVERKRRRVAIYELELEGFRGGEHPQVDVFVRCSKGTYIRSIAEDLGKALGCGGHVSVLRRVQAGPFDESKAVTLEQLEALRDDDAFEALDALLEPADAAISDLPKLELVDSAADFILQGQPVMALHGPMAGEVRLYRKNGGFLGLGEMTDDGRVAPKRLIATNSD